MSSSLTPTPPKKRKIGSNSPVPTTFDSVKTLLSKKSSELYKLKMQYNTTKNEIESLKKQLEDVCHPHDWERELTYDPHGRGFYEICKKCKKYK